MDDDKEPRKDCKKEYGEFTEKEIKLTELRKMEICDTWQSNYLFKYFLESTINLCDEQIENKGN